jgi:excisionase family DNA binding protein
MVITLTFPKPSASIIGHYEPASDTGSPPLTVEEVAAHFRVDAATVRGWCREGRLPGAERVGKRWQIPSGALASTARTPAADPETAPEARGAAAVTPPPTEAATPDQTTSRTHPATQPAPRHRQAPRTGAPAGAPPDDRPFDRSELRRAWTTPK